MDDLKQYLLSLSREKGICAEGLAHMRADSLPALVDYYLENPDWCLERNFPDLDCLKRNFSNIEDKGVFVGRKFNGELLNDLQVYIFHKCSGTVKVSLNVDKRIIPMLYVANGSRIRFVGVGDNSFIPFRKEDRTQIPVYSFGKNSISAKDNRWVSFIHFKNSLL